MFEFLFKYSRADYARSELVYLGDWPAWLLTGLVIAAVIAITTGLILRRRQARWFQLLAIGALQLAMVALVAWALLEPTLATDRLRDGENAVALVVDTSESMAHGEPETRFEQALASLAVVLDGDSPDLAVRHYEMGATARPVDSFIHSTPTEDASSIAASLTGILDQARFSPLAAVVLGSDGADTGGGLDASELAAIAAYGVPVHTIGVGREAMPEDLELDDISMPSHALPGSTLSARVTVRHDGPSNSLVKVYDGDELLEIVPLELPADAESTTTWVEVSLAEAGPHELSFSIESGDTETELRNNARSTLVNVASQTYRILYFEGEPRWEYKFMRRAVGNDEDLRIETLLRVSPNKFYRQGIDSPEQLEDGFPTTRDELFGYDALIIGSVEAAMLTQEQQLLVRDFVSERGGSLMMIAGPSGLGNGGWGQSELADVLPAALPPTSVDTFHRKKAAVRLTPQGASHQMLRFAAEDDDNAAAWLELPEVADYQVLGELKPAAMALLDADTDIGRMPLLVAQPFGKGRAYILATGGTWRWQMSMPVEDVKHETFWRQVLRAMVASAPDNVSLDAHSGESGVIALRADFRDDAFNPLDNVGVAVVASHEDGDTVSINMQPDEEPGVYTSRFQPSHSGTWYFEALAQRDGEPVAVGRSSLIYETGQAEHFGFRSNPQLLRRLSEATGGRYFNAGNLDGLPDLLRYSSAGITETEYRAIWDAPIVFLLLILLKGGEWLMRRRWGTI